MSKPITYWVDTQSIQRVEKGYGSRLQGLTAAQKFELIGCLAMWAEVRLSVNDDYGWADVSALEFEPDDEVEDILDNCRYLDIEDMNEFIKAIANTITKA
jgi:hypothetical protein